jgi:hypothetical protein
MKNTATKTLMLLAAICASEVYAQGASPTLAPFPLEITRPSNLSAKQREELNAMFRVLLRRGGAITPDGAKLRSALAEIAREDCDRADQCLAELAAHAGALYGIFASVNLTSAGEVVAFGRVVRDDGKLIASLAQADVVKVTKGKASFSEVAGSALQTLIERLGVRSLPLAKPVEVTPEVKPPTVVPEKEPVVQLPPPPLPPVTVVDQGAGQRSTGQTLVIVGGSVVVVGAVLFAIGQGVGGGLTLDGNQNLPREQLSTFHTAQTLSTAGLIGLGAGAAAAAVGAVIWGIAPGAPIKAVVVPSASGATFSVQGAF